MQIQIVENNGIPSFDITHVLTDIFWLSQLNWNTPEIDINQSILLRFTDQKLERYALELDEELDYDEWTDTDHDELGEE